MAAQSLGCGGAGMEAAEAVIRAGMLQAGCGMLEKLLAADPGYRGPRVPCGQGHEAAFVSYRDKVIDTVLGPVTLTRAWYHCAACGHGLAPRDAGLGVAGQAMSPGPAGDERPGCCRRAVREGRPAAGEPGRSAPDGQARRAGRRGQRHRGGRRRPGPGRHDHCPQARAVPAVPAAGQALRSDRRHRRAHDREETAGRDGKGEDGRARTREVKLAVFFTQDKLDDEGHPVRDRDSSSYIATFEPAAAFAGLVEAEGIRRGAGHVRQLTILGDGAPWIWNIATAKFPEATQIVDLFHAREHLHALARSLEFMLGDHKDDWLAARLEDLDCGDIDGICAAARIYPLEGIKKTELNAALGYFETNAPRMRYHWFRSRGLFVGSGAVESGCKAVIGQRLKLSGMHWTVAGASAITTLRCQQASRPEDQIWKPARNQTPAA